MSNNDNSVPDGLPMSPPKPRMRWQLNMPPMLWTIHLAVVSLALSSLILWGLAVAVDGLTAVTAYWGVLEIVTTILALRVFFQRVPDTRDGGAP